jgi:hypothetical protein
MSFAKGQFQTFRAITKVHLGSLADNLMEGEEVEFDGYTLRRGGQDHPLHQLRGAIKVGWLVPQNAPDTQYVPQPAGVVVHRADGMNGDEITLTTASEEDVNVGTLQQVRPNNAPKTHKARQAGVQSDSDGVVVAKFKSPAQQDSVQVGKNDRQVVQSLDNKTSLHVERVATTTIATGDVEEAIVADTLEALLPNAVSTGRPDPKPAPDALSLIQQFIPGFEWDMGEHWRKRGKVAVEKFGHIPVVLDYILSIEADGVKKDIQKRLKAG